MKILIEHIAIYTTDLERLKAFYQKYFNAESNEKYQNKAGFSSYFLTFSSGTRLEIMSHTELIGRDILDKVNGISHFAFSVGSRENVIALTERIINDGYTLLSPLRETGDGYFESCIADPDGNRVEITL
jgi:lactoylglutathione lyase